MEMKTHNTERGKKMNVSHGQAIGKSDKLKSMKTIMVPTLSSVATGSIGAPVSLSGGSMSDCVRSNEWT